MKQLDPKTVWLFFFSYSISAIVWAFLISFWVFVSSINEEASEMALGDLGGWVLGFLVLFLIVAFVWAKLTYHFYRYELTDAGFRKESGVIWKKYVTIPYARIQNVDINRGILARILGLSDLHIQTAGASAVFTRYGAMGAGSEGRLFGVSKQDAELLRDELVRRAGTTGQGL